MIEGVSTTTSQVFLLTKTCIAARVACRRVYRSSSHLKQCTSKLSEVPAAPCCCPLLLASSSNKRCALPQFEQFSIKVARIHPPDKELAHSREIGRAHV